MKPGRKRRQCRRQPNGQPRRERDNGTDQLQAHRAWYAQNGDPTLTTYPLGILKASGDLSEELHRAGLYYAWLHAAVSQKGTVAAQRFEKLPQSHERASEDPKYVKWYIAVMGKYDAGRKAVYQLGNLKNQWLTKGNFINRTVWFEVMPRFLLPKRRIANDQWESDTLFEGLMVLARTYGQIRREPFDKSAKSG